MLKKLSVRLLAMAKGEYGPDQRVLMSEKPITEVISVPSDEQPTGHKPNGLWYSIGNEWIDWVRGNSPSWEGDYVYIIDLDPSKILHLSSGEDVDNMSSLFGSEYYPPFVNKIDWKKVAQSYSGIEINPLFHASNNWNWSWDIPSGCVWNPDAIVNLTEVESPQKR